MIKLARHVHIISIHKTHRYRDNTFKQIYINTQRYIYTHTHQRPIHKSDR